MTEAPRESFGFNRMKASDHRQWVKDLRSRARADAARLIAERYPHLSAEEVQERLAVLDAPPPPIKMPDQPTKRAAKAQAALKRAISRARNSQPAKQDELSKKLLADVEEGRLRDLQTSGNFEGRGSRKIMSGPGQSDKMDK